MIVATNFLSDDKAYDILSLSFCQWVEIDNKALEDFGRNLANLKQINRINLNFKSIKKITRDGVQGLLNCLSGLEELKELEMDFGSCSLLDINKFDFSNLPNHCQVTIWPKDKAWYQLWSAV